MKVTELFEGRSIETVKKELEAARAKLDKNIDAAHAGKSAAKFDLAGRVEQLEKELKSLQEGYTPPVKNKKLGFSADHKIPTGGTKEWLSAFGATAQHIEQALRVVKQSQVYRSLKQLGLTDASTERHTKNGSIMFTGSMANLGTIGRTALRQRRIKFTVQANGKIDETASNDIHRAPVASGKPHIVRGDPVSSIVKTMTNALEKLEKTMVRRRTAEKKSEPKAK